MRVKRVEHVAIAVHNMKDVMRVFQDKLGLALEYEEDFPQYATKIAMYPVGETYLELLESTGESSDVGTWIAEHGQGLYHICLEVDDIEAALVELQAKGVKLLDERPRIGHGGSLIAFIDPRSTADILVELMQAPVATAGHEVSVH
jgi:methylmalonyl-CoA/ethylmalonyl-CoA epimerase